MTVQINGRINASDRFSSAMEGPSPIPDLSKPKIVLIDDDDLFRESISLNLVEEGFDVVDFAAGQPALDYFAAGRGADAILLDWRMPEMDGMQVLRRLREAEVNAPVIFLTALGDDLYEELALEGGAIDYVDKAKRLSILVKRLRLTVAGSRGTTGEEATVEPSDDSTPVVLGDIELRPDICRAWWRTRNIDLTVTEFRIVHLLVGRRGEDVSYRQIYDLVHGKDFIAGHGAHGYRANVRSLIKRIRNKFRNVDDGFGKIANYPGFGYRWLDSEDS
jgi:two-component system, OmpR family, response regulator ChvI